MNVLILYYSLYGHTQKMAEAVAEGVREVEGAQALLRRVPETLPREVLEQMGALSSVDAQSHIPTATPEDLARADAILFGSPTRFGNVCGQMRQFMDSTGGLWAKGALVGKVGSVFVSSATQHGGQESTILSFLPTLLHHGMLVAGLPYTFQGQGTMDEISGGSPYGSSTIAGGDGSRTPSENEMAGARFQGRFVAGLAARLGKA